MDVPPCPDGVIVIDAAEYDKDPDWVEREMRRQRDQRLQAQPSTGPMVIDRAAYDEDPAAVETWLRRRRWRRRRQSASNS